MLKEEFEKMIGKEVSRDDYDIVETVYTWHPAISDTEGKKQIAELYSLGGGLSIIRSMLPVAEAASSAHWQIVDLEHKARLVEYRTKFLEDGDMQFEEVLHEVERMFWDCESEDGLRKLVEGMKKTRPDESEMIDKALEIVLTL